MANLEMCFPNRVATVLDEQRRLLGLTEADMSRLMDAKPGYWKRRMNGQEMTLYEFRVDCKAVSVVPSSVIEEVERRFEGL